MTKDELLARLADPATAKMEADYPFAEQLTPAAVLMPIVLHDNPTLLLTRRADHLKHHAGQISFPGGRREPSDNDLRHTALRETTEETGLSADFVKVVDELPRYRTISEYQVTPFVGLVTPGFSLQADANEVDVIFEAPLSFLLDPANHRKEILRRAGGSWPVYYIEWQEHTIWGATAAFIRMLSIRLKLLSAPAT